MKWISQGRAIIRAFLKFVVLYPKIQMFSFVSGAGGLCLAYSLTITDVAVTLLEASCVTSVTASS